MMTNKIEITAAGKTFRVPSAEICGRQVVVTGNWLRKAAIKDEDLVEGQLVEDPQHFLREMKKSSLRADILTFSQKIPDCEPKQRYHFEWDNWAVVPIKTYDDWWENRVPQETRKNVRRAAKRGVTVKGVCFNDAFVKGIQGIYDETPIRQGRPFWHFGKDFQTIKRESSTYLDRSEFIGAYFNDELIGFIKIVYVDRLATIIHILSKNAHQDKRPINALLAKAVEVCNQKAISYLIYGKYTYEGNEDSPLMEFKRRNGFEEIRYPRYFVPFTAKGRLAIEIGLHRGVKALIPQRATSLLRSLRAQFYQRRYSAGEDVPQAAGSVQ